MKLAHRVMGTGTPLVVLHGLFGSGDNWQSLAKTWSEDFMVVLVDQRNHGRSPHSEAFNYEALADDLNELLADLSIDKAIFLGHSMGGKAALRFAQKFPDQVISAVIVDMGIKAYPPHHSDVLEVFKAVDLSMVESRSDAEAFVAPIIPNQGTAQFILKNLYRTPEGAYAWRLNFAVLEQRMTEIVAALPPERSEISVLFIGGSQSDYILPADYPAILEIFPNASFTELPTGHWVHAEDPAGLDRLFKEFVTS